MKVTVAELRALAEKFFTFLEDFGHDPVDITHDYYWDIFAPDLYNPYEEPTDFGLGQLAEEWPELKAILEGKFEAELVSLGWYAALLRAISHELLATGYAPSEDGKTDTDAE